MSDKAYKKAHEKVSEEVKKLAHSSDDNAQFMQLQKYNSVVAGLHEYYCISTEVSHDFRTIEYADNRISLYAAQYGKCAVTGIPMDSHDIHCHHKVPVSNGGSDEYANLILVSKAVHILIHASSELTIEKYLKSLNLDNKQIEKLNKLRIMAEMPPIIL